jgi:hypothetical protein
MSTKFRFITLLTIPAVLGMATPSLFAATFERATVTRTHNEVYLIDAQKDIQPAKPSDTMNADMVLATGARSRAELQFPDQTLARIGSNSYFTFSEGSRDMELGKGTMLLKVPKNLGGAKITTQAVTAAITGTTVMLETNPGPAPVFLSGITVPPLPGFAAASTTIPTSRLDGTYKSQGKTAAVAKEVTGNCRILRPGTSQSQPLQAGDPVPVGSYLMTDGSGSALISPMPGIAVTIDNSTSTRLETLASTAESSSRKPEIHFDLKKGTIHSAIARSSREPVDFKIRTPQGIAAARGTVTSTSTDGQTSNTFSAHGNVVWIYPNNQEQPIVPGTLVPFSGQGGQVTMGAPIPASDPRFQRFLRRAIILVNRAADAGLIRPDLPVAVLQTMRQANVPVTPQQQQQLEKPREPAGDRGGSGPGTPTGGQPPQQGQGYSKLVVLEGDMRVFLNNRVGESRIIRPGQMIILNPMATRLPEPVNVRLDRLVGTSKLVNGFTDTDDADAPDSGGGKPDPVRNDPTIKETINDQKEKIRNPDNPNSTNRDPRNSKKTLTDVELRLVGTNVQSAPFRGRPTTFPGTFTVGPDSGVSTNPTLVDNISTPGDKIEGNVYYPSLDGNLTNWMFGSTNSLDERAGITSPFGPGELLAGFKADQFRIAGNPTTSVGSIFNGSKNISVSNLAFIGVDGIDFSGSPTFNPINGGFNRLNTLLFTTEDGPIDASGSTFNLPGLDILAFYARESDVSTIGLGGATATSTSNLNLNNLSFNGNGLIGIAGRSLDFIGATIGSSINPVDFVELKSGHRTSIDSGTSVFANAFEAGSLLFTEMTGGTINTSYNVELGSEDILSVTGGTIRTRELGLYAGIENNASASSQGTLYLDPSVIDDSNLNWVDIHADYFMEIFSDFQFAHAPYTMVSIGDGGTLYAFGNLKSVDELMGGQGSTISVDGELQARMVNADALEMTGPNGILPFVVDPNDPNRFHQWNIGSFSGNYNPINFFGLDDVDGINGGTGGELQIQSAGDLNFEPSGFGDAFFRGGNATGTSGVGGDGGLLFLTADNNLFINGVQMDASTGSNGTGTLRGGQGGELDFSSEGYTYINGSIIEVSSDVTGRKSEGGGQVTIESNFSVPASTSDALLDPVNPPVDPSITIGNSTQILSLLDAGATGRGGRIMIQSNSEQGYIFVDFASLKASPSTQEDGTIDIVNNAANSAIHINDATIEASSVRIMSNFDGGRINISSGSSISATNLLEIAAGFNSTNSVRFYGGGTVNLEGNPIEIKGYTVQIDNGTSVNNQGPTNVTANMRNYNTTGYGSFIEPINELSP